MVDLRNGTARIMTSISPAIRNLRIRTPLSTRSFSSSTARAEGQLSGQRCLITGASQGIGLAIANLFAREGASCIAVGRQASSLRPLVDDLNVEFPNFTAAHSYRVGDVADQSFWAQLRKEVTPLDILVNAAGVAQSSLLVTTTNNQVSNIVHTNFMGTIWACRSMSRVFVRQRKGCIINISSLLGVKGGKGSSVYAASKAGIVGLTRSLAAELGTSGIRVNAILPGYIDTGMTKGMPKGTLQEARDAIPLKRLGTVEEVADAALFLARNSYTNNCMLNIDGGLSAT